MKAKRLFLVISFLELQFMVSSALGVFDYTDFSSITGIDLVGDANHIPAENRIRLTPSEAVQAGAAWYTTQVPVVGGFETVFEFQIGDTSFPSGADGIAFLIQNDSVSALGGSGGNIGYTGIYSSLAVEFDTHWNRDIGDPDENHISVQSNGTNANSSDHYYSLGETSVDPNVFVFEDGNSYEVKITYVSDTLNVFVNDLPVLTVSGVNLGSRLGLSDGKAWVGFTAATGARWENQDILNWSFVPEPATLSLLGLGSLVLLRKRRA